MMRSLPDCATWSLPDVALGGDGYHQINVWQGDRCGMCGPVRAEGLVMDHDHATGLIRGRLCRGCNLSEPCNSSSAFVAWRAGVNPAGILGLAEEYRHLFPGAQVMEEAARTPIPDSDLDLIADAVSLSDDEFAAKYPERPRMAAR
jgi:hypothetical protein